MKAVIQRVSQASVHAADEEIGTIDNGLLVLLGVAKNDTEKDAAWLADKCVNLRIFEDTSGKMNLSLLETGGSILVVSQFTLLGDCRKGRRPSWNNAATPETANALYEHFVALTRDYKVSVCTGRFKTMMDVSLINHGPVTILLDTKQTDA